MRRRQTWLKACFLALGVGFAASAAMAAGPLAPTLPASEGATGALLLVHGCHPDVRRGYVPEFGGRALHYHRGPRCRPVIADGGRRGGPPPGARWDRRRDGRDFRGGRDFRDGPRRRDGPPPRRRNCVRVGPVEVCE